MLSKCFSQHVNKSRRPSSGHRTGKGQSLSQFQRRAVLKNVQTTGQLHSSMILVRSCFKILHARLPHYVNQETLDIQVGYRNGRGTRDQVASIRWLIEKAREFQKNIYLCFTDYVKAFDYADQNKLWKALEEMRIADHLGGSDGKASVSDAGDPGSIPGLGTSLGEGNGNPLQ